MEAVALVLVCALLLAFGVAAISALVSAVRLPAYAWQSAGRSKAGTVLGIVCTGGIGGIYYWLSIRRVVKAAGSRTSPPPRRDPWTPGDW